MRRFVLPMAFRLRTRDSLEIQLPVDRDDCARICRSTLETLGWELEDDSEPIEAFEPADRLCCVTWPVDLTLTVADAEGGCRLTMEGTTPGRGPLQKRQLRDRMGRLRAELLQRTGMADGTQRR